MLVLSQCRTETICSQSFFSLIFFPNEENTTTTNQKSKKTPKDITQGSFNRTADTVYSICIFGIFCGHWHYSLLVVLTPSMSLPKVPWFLNEWALRIVSSFIWTNTFVAKYYIGCSLIEVLFLFSLKLARFPTRGSEKRECQYPWYESKTKSCLFSSDRYVPKFNKIF